MKLPCLVLAFVAIALCTVPALGSSVALIKIDDLTEGAVGLTWDTGGQITDPFNIQKTPELVSFEFDFLGRQWGSNLNGVQFYSLLQEPDGTISDALLLTLSNIPDANGALVGHTLVQFASDPNTLNLPTTTPPIITLQEDGTFQELFSWNDGNPANTIGRIQVASDVDAVPLPGAVWMGLALMGGLVIRRRAA